jgi:hypothetical protein
LPLVTPLGSFAHHVDISTRRWDPEQEPKYLSGSAGLISTPCDKREDVTSSLLESNRSDYIYDMLNENISVELKVAPAGIKNTLFIWNVQYIDYQKAIPLLNRWTKVNKPMDRPYESISTFPLNFSSAQYPCGVH